MRRPPSGAYLLTGAIGIGVVVALGGVIYLLGNGPLRVDSWWHDLMLAWRTDAGLEVARALEVIGGTLGVTLITLGLATACVIGHRPWDAVTIVVAVLAAATVTGALKVGFARPRPEDSLSTEAMTAFPSGHVSMAATLAVVLALSSASRIAWVYAAAWIAAMAWSRTYLEAHWFTDVVAGAILGTSVTLAAWAAIASTRRTPDDSTVPGDLGRSWS